MKKNDILEWMILICLHKENEGPKGSLNQKECFSESKSFFCTRNTASHLQMNYHFNCFLICWQQLGKTVIQVDSGMPGASRSAGCMWCLDAGCCGYCNGDSCCREQRRRALEPILQIAVQNWQQTLCRKQCLAIDKMSSVLGLLWRARIHWIWS